MYSEHGRGLHASTRSQRKSLAPVLSGSTDALPDDGSTAGHWHRFSLPLWSPSLEPERPTAPLWRGLRRSWSSPGCENRWWVSASSRRLGCGWSWSWARSSQQPGINSTSRLGSVLVPETYRTRSVEFQTLSSLLCGNEILAASVNWCVTRAGLLPGEKSPTKNPKHTPS